MWIMVLAFQWRFDFTPIIVHVFLHKLPGWLDGFLEEERGPRLDVFYRNQHFLEYIGTLCT